MPAASDYRWDVPDRDLLARLTDAQLPLGTWSRPGARNLFRDIYFDTAEGDLRNRGVTCRFRFDVHDRRVLSIEIDDPAGLRAPGAHGSSGLFETEVQETDPAAAMRGSSEPARRLQGVVNPDVLVPRLELEVERVTRVARGRILPLPLIELAFDAVVARRAERVTRFQEILAAPRTAGRRRLGKLAAVLETTYQLSPLTIDRFERAWRELDSVEGEELGRFVRDRRAVAVIALEGGCIALNAAADGLRLPFASGQGETSCRDALRGALGSAEGRLRLLGPVPATETRPAIEVWLARDLRREPTPEEDENIVWITPAELVTWVGSPVLRDTCSLAALTVAARSDLMPEWTTLEPEGKPGPTPVVSSKRVSKGRLSLDNLRAVTLSDEALDPAQLVPEHFINRDLSWIEFNTRVLSLAEDPGVPLLERIRFLAIVARNLDEFFMVRVADIKRRAIKHPDSHSPDGLTPRDALDALAVKVRALVERQYRCFEAIKDGHLDPHKIDICRWSDLEEPARAELAALFREQYHPALTPKTITRTPGHPFPTIRELATSLALVIRDPGTGTVHLAQLEVPDSLPRLVPLGADRHRFVPIEEIIGANIGALYPGREVAGVHVFRVTRAADFELSERATADLVHAVEEGVRRRPLGAVVRMEVARSMPATVRELLLRELQFEAVDEARALSAGDVYEIPGLLDHSCLGEIASLQLPALRYPPFEGRTVLLASETVFDVLDRQDVLVHHPYDEFESSVQRLFEDAADDPAVIAIKLTLYRPGGFPELSDALRRAVGAGKEVCVVVELKARFDEVQNIQWARELEVAGAHVVTGFTSLKTHCKAALVVRHTAGAPRYYSHIGSGNYNAQTARLYTDVGLLTANQDIGRDLNALFNDLTGSPQPPRPAEGALLTSPGNLLERLLYLVRREGDHARAGRGGRIRMKLNGIEDAEVISALYQASQAGVEIDIIVRGPCALRPGVAGLSDRVRVASTVGRFLEHARILHFQNGGRDEYFIGSADLRPRNLRRRVETVTQVLDPAACERLDAIFETELDDPLAWRLNPDGSYARVPAPTGVELRSAQERFIEMATARR